MPFAANRTVNWTDKPSQLVALNTSCQKASSTGTRSLRTDPRSGPSAACKRDSDLSQKIGIVSQKGAADSHRFCFGGFRRRAPRLQRRVHRRERWLTLSSWRACCRGKSNQTEPWSPRRTERLPKSVRFGEMSMAPLTAHRPQLRFRRSGRLLSKAGLPTALICDEPVIGCRRRRPSIGCRPKSLQVVFARPRSAADIQESRAGTKSPTLNVDAPTQWTVHSTSLCVGKMLIFLFHPHNGECHCITQHVFSPSGPATYRDWAKWKSPW